MSLLLYWVTYTRFALLGLWLKMNEIGAECSLAPYVSGGPFRPL